MKNGLAKVCSEITVLSRVLLGRGERARAVPLGVLSATFSVTERPLPLPHLTFEIWRGPRGAAVGNGFRGGNGNRTFPLGWNCDTESQQKDENSTLLFCKS